MRKRITYLTIYLIISLSNKAQVNLVPNYSFEDTLGACKSSMGISTLSTSIVKNWTTVGGNTPDYFNNCANSISYPNICTVPYSYWGYQMPHFYNSYVGIGTYYFIGPTDSSKIDVEYLITRLKKTLISNSCYYAELYANQSNYSKLATNQISLYFTPNIFTTSLYTFTNTIKPQVQWDTTKYFTDTLNWVKISGYFMAQGGEEYLTIGNFRDGTHLSKKSINSNFINSNGGGAVPFLSYVFIDDVSLYELHNHTGTQSYTLCAGDSLLLGDTVSLPMRYQWSLNGLVVDTTKNIMVVANGASSASATVSSPLTYVLQTKHCTTQTQTITIVVDDGCNPPLVTEPTIPNVFTPNGDGVNDVFEFSLPKNWTLSGAEVKSFNVFNRWGNSVHELEAEALEATNGGGNNGSGTSSASVTTIIWDGRTTSGIECSAGVYFYTLEYVNSNGELKKKNGYISLIL